MLSNLAAKLATECRHGDAIDALVEEAGGDADRLHDARAPFMLRLHADASDLDASRALAAIERASRRGIDLRP